MDWVVPRLGVKSELQLLAYATATATQDPSRLCDLHHSSRQCQILNPVSEARDRTCILMDTSLICFHCATTGTPYCSNSYLEIILLYLPLCKCHVLQLFKWNWIIVINHVHIYIYIYIYILIELVFTKRFQKKISYFFPSAMSNTVNVKHSSKYFLSGRRI